ncbi:hypothetical protein P0Y35_01015 [Kiritimatiellaeota bacterium B1221]|nr:hypothetical protein [Kiritimatiellaeota bacterium B1221]
MEKFYAQIRSTPDIFTEIPFENGQQSDVIRLRLHPVKLVSEEGQRFDGLQFTVPRSAKGMDLVWYFNAPANWAHWYILPLAADEEMQGFRNWIPADVLYRDVDLPQEADRFRTLQTLDSENLVPGHTYIIWFRETQAGEDLDLRVKLCFSKPEEDWTHKNAEAALALEWQSLDIQAAHLESRGGKMLLDPAFFEKNYAETQIKSVISERRMTQQFPGGFFVTMETATPPCRTRPDFHELQKKYGPADFIETATQKRARALFDDPDRGQVDEAEDANPVDTHYYDYFAFEVQKIGDEKIVTRVRTQAVNFSALQPAGDEPTFEILGMKNLTVFYRKRKEVGRAYYFMEGPGDVLLMTEPPPGVYQRKNETLAYLGQEKWLLQSWSNDHKLYREIPLAGNQWSGSAKGYYEDGTLRWEAHYLKGELN